MDDLVQEVTKKEETANQAKILYLKKVDDKIAIKQGVNFKGIQLDLNVVASISSMAKIPPLYCRGYLSCNLLKENNAKIILPKLSCPIEF